MHELFTQVLSNKDLSKAGDLFSVPDSSIINDLTEVVTKISEITSLPDYVNNNNDQSVVEICITRVTSAIRETDSIEQHAEALVGLLESCLNHNLKPSPKDEDPPHAKISSDIISCIFLNYNKKDVMKRALPVAVKLLHKGNRELSRNMASYLSLAVIHNAPLLSQHIQLIIDSVISGNYPLCRVLPQIYAVTKDPIHEHAMALVSLLPQCDLSEKLALLQLFALVAHNKPLLLEASLPQLCEYLATNSTILATMQIFLHLAEKRPQLLVDYVPKLKQANEGNANTLCVTVQVVAAVGRLNKDKAQDALNFILAHLPKADRSSQSVLLREATLLCSTYPVLCTDKMLAEVWQCSRNRGSGGSGSALRDDSVIVTPRYIQHTHTRPVSTLGGGSPLSQSIISQALSQSSAANLHSIARPFNSSSVTPRRHNANTSVTIINNSNSNVPAANNSAIAAASQLLEASLPQLCEYLATNSTILATMQIFLHLAEKRPQLLVDYVPKLKQANEGNANTLCVTVQVVAAVGRLNKDKAQDALNFILAHLPKADRSSQSVLLREATLLCSTYPVLCTDKMLAEVWQCSRNSAQVNQSSNNNGVTIVTVGGCESATPTTKSSSVESTNNIPPSSGGGGGIYKTKNSTVISTHSTNTYTPNSKNQDSNNNSRIRPRIGADSRSTSRLNSSAAHRSMTRLNIASSSRLGSVGGLHKSMTRLSTSSHINQPPSQSQPQPPGQQQASSQQVSQLIQVYKQPPKPTHTYLDQEAVLNELRHSGFCDVFEYGVSGGGKEASWGCFLCNHPERAVGFLQDSHPVIEGQLKEKKGRWKIFKRWRTRYFTLSGAHLSYKGSKEDKQETPIDVHRIRSVKVSRGARNIPKAFEIFTGDDSLILKPKNGKNAEQWVQCLSVVVAHSQAKEMPTRGSSLVRTAV
ncbi:protein melted [Diaphorina citri]|uniref:Protein melted n=1 Tax=Diaphorina citri TaxID=121845 RepID=A0A3Q0IY81_DIACI|nr:protein melted [Diaphorina citri]